MSCMAAMDRLMATARTRLPGATDAALNLELFNTIDEFFRKSNAWRFEQTVPISEGNVQFPIFPPGGTDLVRVMSASHNGVPMAPSTAGDTGGVITQVGRISGVPNFEFDATFTPNTTQSPGGVFRYSVFYPQFVTIDIPPSDTAAQFPILLLMALTLSKDVLAEDCGDWPLEDWMPDTYHEAWIDGLQGRLMSMIAKPYTNLAGAQYHLKRFRQAISFHKQEGDRGFVYNKRRLRFNARSTWA